MAFCTLEEAWGNDYKSFLSPASLEPNWLARRKQKEIHDAKKWTTVPTGIAQGNIQYDQPESTTSLEQFNPMIRKRDDDDSDLYQDYDEFNLPLELPGQYSKDPKPSADGIDDYYKLVDSQYDSQYDMDTVRSYNHSFQPGYNANGDYETESPYTNSYIKKHRYCNRLDSLKHHIPECKDCQAKLRKILGEIEGKSDSKDEGGVTENVLSKLIDSTSLNSIPSSPYKSYIELIFFIAIGVFLIFTLDTFVRLGRVFHKRR